MEMVMTSTVLGIGRISSDIEMRIPCPSCGDRDYTEFKYAGDANKPRPLHGTNNVAAWHDYVFVFENPRGVHREYWQHVLGCRQWLILERNTETNAVGVSVLARNKVGT